MLGVQVASALRDLYGRNGAETISGLCGTRVVLAAPGPGHRAVVGRQPRAERDRGGLRGVLLRRQHHPRRGEPDASHRELRALALPSEIMRLENLSGYLKFPGPFPVACDPPQIRLPSRRRPSGSCRVRRTGRSRAARPDERGYRAIGAGGRRPCGDGGIAIPALPAARRDRVRKNRSPAPEAAPDRGPLPDGPEPVPLPDEAAVRRKAPGIPRTANRRPGTARRGTAGLPATGPASRSDMVASIGAVAAPSQGASYYERDGYYAKDDPEHKEASAWAGRGAEELGLTGPVDPDTFRAVLEGRVPDGSDTRLGRQARDGEHRAPSRPRPHPLGPEVGLARRAGRRRCARGGCPRPGRRAHPRLVREERRRDPDEGFRRPAAWSAPAARRR